MNPSTWLSASDIAFVNRVLGLDMICDTEDGESLGGAYVANLVRREQDNALPAKLGAVLLVECEDGTFFKRATTSQERRANIADAIEMTQGVCND